MQHGDLSSHVVPSIVIVFEGAVATVAADDQAAFDKHADKGDWVKAVDLFALNPRMLDKINHLIWFKEMNIEICTWYPDEAAFFIGELMDQENIPVKSVWSSEPDKLARQLIHLPRIARIYDPDPAHVFKYGGKGVHLTDVNQIGRL